MEAGLGEKQPHAWEGRRQNVEVIGRGQGPGQQMVTRSEAALALGLTVLGLYIQPSGNTWVL